MNGHAGAPPLCGTLVVKAALERQSQPHSVLFLKGFEKEFENQKYHWLNCVHEVYDENGKHYYEGRADMDFHLYRGTNCNEAWHRKLNASVSSTSSSSSAVFAQSNSDLRRMNTNEHGRVITKDDNFQSTTAEDEMDNIHHTNSANLFYQNDQPSSADTKKYILVFNWKGYSYDEMKSVVLPKHSPSQNLSEYEDQILLYAIISDETQERKTNAAPGLDKCL